MSPTNTEIPTEFLCPLTLQVLENPLVSRDGMCYERSAIVEWLDRGNESCPLTRKPLRLSSLIHNMPLKLRIQQWKREAGYQEQPGNEINSHNNKGFRIEVSALMVAADCNIVANSNENENGESAVEQEGEEDVAPVEDTQAQVEDARAPLAIVTRNKNDRTDIAATNCARHGRNWLPLLRGGRKVNQRGAQ